MDQENGNSETIKPVRQHFPSANQFATSILLFPPLFIKTKYPIIAPIKLIKNGKNDVNKDWRLSFISFGDLVALKHCRRENPTLSIISGPNINPVVLNKNSTASSIVLKLSKPY